MNLDPATADMTADDHHAARNGEVREPVAAYCFGPGHVLDEWDMRVEHCPECKGKGIRNHATARRVPA